MFLNLKNETLYIMEQHGYSVEDIDWIGNYNFTISINEFFKIAENTNYDNGYGHPEIPIDLMIVFKNKDMIKREEYDGSEWWRFYPSPIRPKIRKHLKVKSFQDRIYDEYLEQYI